MTALPIRARVAGLQVPLSRIQSLALATIQTIDELGGIEDDACRQALGHITNFVDLIHHCATTVQEEAERIEADAPGSLGQEEAR